VEYLAKHSSDPTDANDGLNVVAIDVKDGTIKCFRNVATIRGRPTRKRIGSKPNLIVSDYMNCASHRESRQLMQTHSLIHNALAAGKQSNEICTNMMTKKDYQSGPKDIPECSVAVQGDGHNSASVVVPRKELLRTNLAYNDRVDGLQMRWIRHQRQMYLPTTPDWAIE
jgi:hypothetical protein